MGGHGPNLGVHQAGSLPARAHNDLSVAVPTAMVTESAAMRIGGDACLI